MSRFAGLGILLLAPLLAAASCDGGEQPVTQSPAAAPIPFETIVQDRVPGQSGATLRVLIQDEPAWREVWAALQAGSSLPAEPPAVDFSRDVVVVAAMETQGCVSKVTVRSVTAGPGEFVVGILEEPPAPNCTCITSERPFHAVRFAKPRGGVRFDIERGETSCS